MEPKHINDILPLISVQSSQLDQFKRILEEQKHDDSAENPIYYFSSKLKVCLEQKVVISIENVIKFINCIDIF